MDLGKLKLPFPASKIHWRVGATNVKKDGSIAFSHSEYPDVPVGIPFAYIDARDVMDRLDEVCEMTGWQDDYPFPGCCRIGIKIGTGERDIKTEWIWKANGAGITDVEADKGQYSDAYKRAAVLWGVGRYLYDLPNVWMPIVKSGKSFKFDKATLKDLNIRYEIWVEEYFKKTEDES